MEHKKLIIDGNKFNDLEGFYNEIENNLTKGLNGRIGRNLDAFNDILSGGFGCFEENELVTLYWINSEKSKNDLGKDETIKYLNNKLNKCHPSFIVSINEDIDLLKENKGQTLFDEIIKIIRKYKNIELVFE